jgi:hypothetical protein
MDDAELKDLVRREVRSQTLGMLARYTPLLAGALAFLLLIVLVPDAQQAGGGGPDAFAAAGAAEDEFAPPGAPEAGDALPGSTAGPEGTELLAGGTGAQGGAASPDGLSGPGGVSGPGGGASRPGGAPAQQGGASTGSTAGSSGAPRDAGVARNGTRCGRDVRQFSFTPYAPMCTPAFTGDNGGKTAHGVDAKTITLVARKTSDYDALAPAVGASSFEDSVADLRTLIDFFNTQYELYGRKVVLKTFDGQGSYASETAGQDQAGASADAQKAKDLGAFADLVPPAPAVYADALAARKIITFGLPTSVREAKANYPYKYQSLSAVPDLLARGVADMICQRMAKMRASFAGDAALREKERTFALIVPDTFGSAEGPNVLLDRVKRGCGISVQRYTYNANPAQGPSQAAQIASRLKADGVTTIVLAADAVFAPTMTRAAGQQEYKPEWVTMGPNTNAIARRMDAEQVAHMVFAHPWAPRSQPPAENDCRKIFKLANSNPRSTSLTIDAICKPLLQFFGALHAAGPQLTPATFGKGWFSQPASKGAGGFGLWSFGENMYSPDASFTLQYWRPGVTNPFDGGSGVPVSCNEPANVPLAQVRMGSGQLRCFG